MNQSKGYFPFLDGIRGIAILAVFLFHALGVAFGYDGLPWNGLFRNFNDSSAFLILYPITYGAMGVAIFFVVSGFCIHLSYQRSSNKSWLNYFNRRFFRIYPAYLFGILLFAFVWPTGISPTGTRQVTTHLLAIHNFSKETLFGINPSFWTLAVEIQLYALYPLLLLLISKTSWRTGLLIVFAGEVVIRVGIMATQTFSFESFPNWIALSPFTYWFSWSIGAYLAHCYLTDRSSSLSRVRFDLVAITAFALPLFKPTQPFTFLAFAILTGIAIDRLISNRWTVPTNKVVRSIWRHLCFLGIVSYSFYLLHQPILYVTRQLLTWIASHTSFHPLAMFFICLVWYPVILLPAYLMFRTIELPSVSLGKRFWNRLNRSEPHVKPNDSTNSS